MWIHLTEEDLRRMKEDSDRLFEREMAEAAQKARDRADWLAAHQPCPHCGRSDPLPPWLQ